MGIFQGPILAYLSFRLKPLKLGPTMLVRMSRYDAG